ncbi:MAG: ATP-binding protein [Phormidesmis sp.]
MTDAMLSLLAEVAEDEQKTSRRRAEDDLSTLDTSFTARSPTEVIFQQMLNRSSGLVWLLDTAGRVLQANQTALAFGNVDLSQVANQPIYTSWQFSPGEQVRLKDKIASAVDGRIIRYDATIQGQNSRKMPIGVILREVASTPGQPRLLVMEGIDVSDRKKVEAQLLRCQRLHSVSSMTAGLAHDFGNLLTAMLGSAYVLRKEFPEANERQREMFGLMTGAADRASKMVRQMLAFTKGNDEDCYAAVACDRLINEVIALIGTTLPPVISIETYLPPGLWPINGDENQLYQVLMNLCINACDAMPNGGFLRISAENMQGYESEVVEESVRNYVVIQVSDTGSGIASNILDSIFEPFFTTKENGKGTGLGLSTSKEIVESHGGFIDTLTEASHVSRTGTQFRVYLPAIS